MKTHAQTHSSQEGEETGDHGSCEARAMPVVDTLDQTRVDEDVHGQEARVDDEDQNEDGALKLLLWVERCNTREQKLALGHENEESGVELQIESPEHSKQ